MILCSLGGPCCEASRNWSVCNTLSRSRHFFPSQPKGIRKQSDLMQAKRVLRFRNLEKLHWGTQLWTFGQLMLTMRNKWMLAICFILLKLVSILQLVYSFNNEFRCVKLYTFSRFSMQDKTKIDNWMFTSSPSCSGVHSANHAITQQVLVVFNRWIALSILWITGGSVVWVSGCQAGGREFDSGRTITQGLKIT